MTNLSVSAPPAEIRSTTRIPRLSRRAWTAACIAAIVAILTAIILLLYYRSVDAQFREARQSADDVRASVDGAGQSGTLTSDELTLLDTQLATLQSDLQDLDARLNVPVLGGIARNTPILAPKLEASQQMLDLGIALVGIGRDAAGIASDVRATFETTGFTSSGVTTGPTWLDAVRQSRVAIDQLNTDLNDAIAARSRLDEQSLPDRGRSALDSIDAMLTRAVDLRDEYYGLLPLLDSAFGAEQDANYLVLLQNSEEMRQSGGFPGTFALLTVRDGQLADIRIESTRNLDLAYVANRTEQRFNPAPLREGTGQIELLPHDAAWSADFPEAARQVLELYSVTGWPALQGVIALNDSVVHDILELSGPYTVDVKGESQTITADNYLGIIEEYREKSRHKAVVAALGTALIDHLKSTDFETKKGIYQALRDSANRREIQIYMVDPAMEREVVMRGWDGALFPEPGTPTLAMTVSSIAGGKASPRITARSTVVVSGTDAGIAHVSWTILLEHRGDPQGDPKYNGFHRTWLALYLPDGARLTSSTIPIAPPELSDDPRALGYNLPMSPGDTVELTVEFDLPTPADTLLLRRQSGMNDVKFNVSGSAGSCTFERSFTLRQDYRLAVSSCEVRRAH